MAKKVSGTTLIHGDHDVPVLDDSSVAPPLSVTTTFRTTREEIEFDPRKPATHLYSRYTTSVSTRAEHILSTINHGYAITYASGLSSAYAALVFFAPKRIAITGGYAGVHESMDTYKKANPSIEIIDIEEDFRSGDLCWLETPLNPTGESRDIKYYSDKVHKAGGKIIIDSTFGPPPLQFPFDFGADCVMHSGSKYFGGHSDLLCGILVVKTEKEWETLWHDRTFLGNMMGSLEAWLLLRSLKTFHLRIPVQVENAFKLVQWLHKISQTPVGESFDGIPGGIIEKVWHSSLQGKDARGFEPSQQMKGGYTATFSMLLTRQDYAAKLPFQLSYFTPATSLGGVESVIEHRVRADPSCDPCLVRMSIGVEDYEDLQNDMRSGLNNLNQNANKSKL